MHQLTRQIMRMMKAGASGASDPFFANVSLLLHCESLVDSSSAPATIVQTAGVALTTAQFKYGASSLETTSHAGKLEITKATNLTGTYTVEAWVRATAAVVGDAHNLVATNNNLGTNRVAVDWYANTATSIVGRVVTVNNAIVFTSPSVPYVLGDWVHIAWVNNSADATFKIFIGGALAGTNAGLVDLFNAANYQIAKCSVAWADGSNQQDEIRITVGVARYTTGFTPPTAPFPDS